MLEHHEGLLISITSASNSKKSANGLPWISMGSIEDSFTLKDFMKLKTDVFKKFEL